MGQPFSTLVTSAPWRHEVESWVHDRAEESGRRLSGPLEQVRVRPWSTQLVVPTDHGRLWFKANNAAMRHEPALHRLLAELVPDDVAAPLAVDEARGWLLTADRGPTLGSLRHATTDDWVAVLQRAADVQRRVAGERAAVLATGVHDCSPPTVVGRFDALVEQLSAWPDDHPSRLTADERAALEACRPAVAEAAGVLAASPVPASLQHGDVHPKNAFADLRLFDFGDAQWAHPVEVLHVPHGIIRQDDLARWEPVRDAYFEVWSDVVDRRTMAALFEATAFTQGVHRSVVWVDSIAEATSEELEPWGIGPKRHLLRVVDA